MTRQARLRRRFVQLRKRKRHDRCPQCRAVQVQRRPEEDFAMLAIDARDLLALVYASLAGGGSYHPDQELGVHQR